MQQLFLCHKEVIVIFLQQCDIGKSFTSTTTVCENCVGGKYQGSNTIPAVVCTDCAPGTYTSEEGMDRCKLCAAGKYGSLLLTG